MFWLLQREAPEVLSQLFGWFPSALFQQSPLAQVRLHHQAHGGPEMVYGVTAIANISRNAIVSKFGGRHRAARVSWP